MLQVPTLYEVESSNYKNKLMMITGHYPIRSSFYDDTSQRWSELKKIGEFGGNVSMSSLLKLSNGKYNSFISLSDDSGNTWSKPFESSDVITGDRHIIKYSNDGRLVIVFRDTNPSSQTKGNWVAWVGTYNDLVERKKGQYKINLKKNYFKDDCGYSGLELLDNGEFLATSYGHWDYNEKPYIINTRFSLSELDEFVANI